MKPIITKTVFLLAVISLFSFCSFAQPDGAAIYQQYCATCHGVELKGGNGTSLVDGIWRFGATDSYKIKNIGEI